MDDERLVEAARAGDPAALERLFDRYYPVIRRFFANKVDDPALDLTQRTFLGCAEALPRFRGEGSFRSFLFSIAYRQLRKHYEHRSHREEPVDFAVVSVHDLDPSPSTMLARRDEQRLLLEALRRLPLELQTLLELHYWEQVTTRELAEILGIPQGTVKRRLQRARALLRETIEANTRSPRLLESTLSDLEGWAAKLRDGDPADESP